MEKFMEDRTERESYDEELEAKNETELLNEISELSKKGYHFLKENKIQEAEKNFNTILSQDPNNNYALVGLGDAARKKGRFRDAIDFYKRCLKIHPGNNYALFGLADCYKALNQYAKAIEIWEQYLLHDDKNVTVLTRIADAYRKVRDFARSKEIYLKVLEMEKDNPYALIGLGHLHYDFKEYKEASKYWERMVQIKDGKVDIRVLTSLGNCHRKLKTFEGGILYFSKALDIEPNNFYALFGMADCYRGLNKQDKSLEYWNRILAIDPENKVILTRAGDAYRNMNELDKAEQYYRRALNIEFDAYAILGLALINKQKGNYQDAIESLLGLLKNDERNHRLYIEIAECYVKLNRRDKAVEILNEFQKLGAKNSFIGDFIERLQS